FLVPGSLAIIAASFADADRARAIGTWSGLAAISGAIGPFLGGWLVDAASWRWVFLLNMPVTAVTIAITVRHVPESRAQERAPLDLGGAVLASLGLGGACWALIQGPQHVDAGVIAAGILGAGALAQRIGARIPMTVGPLLVGVGMLLFTRIHPGSHYLTSVLPAAIVFGLGLSLTVAPLTAAVFAAVDADEMGIASGVNNAAA